MYPFRGELQGNRGNFRTTNQMQRPHPPLAVDFNLLAESTVIFVSSHLLLNLILILF